MQPRRRRPLAFFVISVMVIKLRGLKQNKMKNTMILTENDKNGRWIRISYFSILVILLSVFLFSASMGIFDYEAYAKRISGQVFPEAIGRHLPWINLTLLFASSGALIYVLLAERPKQTALLLPMGLMAAYTIYTGLVLANAFGWRPCSCVHIIPNSSWTLAAIVNSGLLSINIIAYAIFPWVERRYRPPQ